MDRARLEELRETYRRGLLEDTLPFWIPAAVDREQAVPTAKSTLPARGPRPPSAQRAAKRGYSMIQFTQSHQRLISRSLARSLQEVLGTPTWGEEDVWKAHSI